MTLQRLWWAIAQQRMETARSLDRVWTRGKSMTMTKMTRDVPPEETSTFNLVRRLAGTWGTRSVALHTRPLENVSGADLELAIQVGPGPHQWIDLVLQAKKLRSSGDYEGWNPAQTAKLRKWSTRPTSLPGMLLYNAPFAPFGSVGTTTSLAGCCTPTIRCSGSLRAPGRLGGVSPLSATVVMVPPVGTRAPNGSGFILRDSDVAAAGANRVAFPLECVFCPHRGRNHGVAGNGSPSRPLPGVPLRLGPVPSWAGRLLGEAIDDIPPDDHEPIATFSLVLPFDEG